MGSCLPAATCLGLGHPFPLWPLLAQPLFSLSLSPWRRTLRASLRSEPSPCPQPITLELQSLYWAATGVPQTHSTHSPYWALAPPSFPKPPMSLCDHHTIGSVAYMVHKASCLFISPPAGGTPQDHSTAVGLCPWLRQQQGALVPSPRS